MALISTWFHSSSATFASASARLSSSFQMWASAFICSARMDPVGDEQVQARPTLLPSWAALLQPPRPPASSL